MTARFGYKLKDGQTEKDWMKALHHSLKQLPGSVDYQFFEWSFGFCIECLPRGSRWKVSIELKRPRMRYYGDIASVNVVGEEIYPAHNKLNRPFRVKEDGYVNIEKIHECVIERIKLIEEYKERKRQNELQKHEHLDNIHKILDGTGVTMEGDEYLKFTCDSSTLNGNLEGLDNVKLKLGEIWVEDRDIPLVLRAWDLFKKTIDFES